MVFFRNAFVATRSPFVLLCLLVTGCNSKIQNQVGATCELPAKATFEAQVAPVLQNACFTCHSTAGGHAPAAGLDLGALALQPEKNLTTWHKAYAKIVAGEMPPAKSNIPTPTDCDRKGFQLWLEQQGPESCELTPPPLTRRLTNVEYDQSVRTLIGGEETPSKDFAPDLPALGFDNIASTMQVTPSHLENYLHAAEKIAAQIVEANPKTARTLATQMEKAGGGDLNVFGDYEILYGGEAELWLPVKLERPQQFIFAVEAYADQAGPELAKLQISMGSVYSATKEIDATAGAPKIYEFKTPILPVGTYRLSIRFPNDFYVSTSTPKQDRNLLVHWIESREQWLPNYAAPAKLQYWTDCRDREANEACAQRLVSEFASLAFRREIDERERASLVMRYREGADAGFLAGLEHAYVAILTSPHFLYRVETNEPNPNQTPRLTSTELATRLSYFLWSAPPDAELKRAAQGGQLEDPGQLLRQTARMMRDPRAAMLTDNFAEQWLGLRRLREQKPSALTFPDFNDDLRDSMIEETKQLFSLVLKTESRVDQLLLANYSFLEPNLASFYGIDVKKTPNAQWVNLAGTKRGGLLTHASILTLSSHPERTSPTTRGKWILENLMCTPPPPPAAGIPAIPEQIPEGLTMRQMLERHVSDPNCASCHRQMDPLGFGLENFNAIGAWREEEAGHPVDSSGRLPNGQAFVGALELREILSHMPEFRQCVTKKFMVYALGRDLARSEQCAINRTTARLGTEDSMSTLVQEIVLSDLFRNKYVEK
jgi:hypothetical protein